MLIQELVTPNTYLKPLFENIKWISNEDGELYNTLINLIKTNNGLFSNSEQKELIFNNVKPRQELATSADTTVKYGITFKPDKEEIYVYLHGSVQWSPLGGKSIQPVGYVFVLDHTGIKKQYKLHYTKGIPNPGKTRKIWERPENVKANAVQQPEPVQSPPEKSEYIGNIGERIKNVRATIKQVLGPYKSDFGNYYLTKLVDDESRNMMYVGKDIGLPGRKFLITFTVKKHEVDKVTRTPTTHIQRPIIKKIPD
jgi:hypothetical protein